MATPEHPLRRWRDLRGWSLDTTAAAVLTSAATVSRIETGRQFPRPDLLARLAELTGVSPNEFLGWRLGR
jgi:transcriptional regulator with XRE-family HTH domain